MADDFKTSFVDFLKERTTTPLWANFIFVWCIKNWHFLIWVIYSQPGNPQLLIEQISNHNFDFWCALFYAIIITILVPLVNIALFYVIEWAKIRRIIIRKDFSKDEWHSNAKYMSKVEEARVLREENEKLDSKIRHFNELKEKLSQAERNSADSEQKWSKTNEAFIESLSANKSLNGDLQIKTKQLGQLAEENLEESIKRSFPDFLLDRDFPLYIYSKELSDELKNDILDNLPEPKSKILFAPNSVKINQSEYRIIMMRNTDNTVFVLCKNKLTEALIEIYLSNTSAIKIYFHYLSTNEKLKYLIYFKRM